MGDFMSALVVTGNASGTGKVSLVAPNTNTDRRITLPNESGEIPTKESLASFLPAAWINFKGTPTVSINSSINFDLPVRVNEGDWTLTFETPLNTDTYAVLISANREDDSNVVMLSYHSQSTTGFSISTSNSAGSDTDMLSISVVVFGGLA